MSAGASDDQLKQIGPNVNNTNPTGVPQQSPSTPQQQAAPPAGPSAGKARLQCHACNRLLEYDAGAQYVQVSPVKS